VKDEYRRVAYVKHIGYNVLSRAREAAEKLFDERYRETDGMLQFDVNPMSML
jgi:hypothetical protein